MSGCRRCGRDGNRRWIDRTTYICLEDELVGVDQGIYPVYFPCDTENVDDDAVAEVEAEEEAERLAARRAEHRRVVAAVTSTAGPRVYCRNGNVAVRRCVECGEDLCFEDSCCGEQWGRTWLCDGCSDRRRKRERREAAEEDRRREATEAARYAALPVATPPEIATHLRAKQSVIVDGRTHRLDRSTYRDLAAALALVSGAGGWTWHHGGGRVVLDDRGALTKEDSTAIAAPGDSCLTVLKGNAVRGAESWPAYRAARAEDARRREADQQKKAADERARARRAAADRARTKRRAALWSLSKPLVVVAPALALVLAALVSYRTGWSEAWFTRVRAPWVYLQIPVNLAAPPLGAFFALFGGFILVGGLPGRNAAGRVRSLLFVLGIPAAAGAVYGSLVEFVPLLRHLAASPLVETLVRLLS